MSHHVEVVKFAREHIKAMEAIEKQSFPESWPADSFERELTDNPVSRYLVALVDGEVAGYIGSWVVLDEVHISTIAVDPSRRNLGLGRRLLASLLQSAVDDGARWTVLEVRESNTAAIRLYESFGFRQVGLRKKYYENEENALVLWVGQMQQEAFRAVLRDRLTRDVGP